MIARPLVALALILSAQLAAAESPSAAPPLRGSAAQVPPAAPPPAGPKRQARPVPAGNAVARQAEVERQRRWDERMRRATRSMCDRC